MIGKIEGILTEILSSSTVCIDVYGLGYEINIPKNIILPNLGEKLMLFTHMMIRQEYCVLYGFNNIHERDIFRLMMKVSGIGSKVALSILANISLEEFYKAILSKEFDRLTNIPGIGKKGAQRLILELYGKIELIPFNENNVCKEQHEIVNALIALGYSSKESFAVIRKIPKDLSLSNSIKYALKLLS